MSGTSLDGVDAALVDFSEPSPRTLGTLWLAYPDDVRGEALGLQVPGGNELHRAALLANSLARCYADAVLTLIANTGHRPEQIAAIGCHGQTVRHQPGQGYTIQLNNPALLAEITEIPVIADFRSRDIAAGGQGAPLVPAFHAAVFADSTEHRVVLNLGGIANLTNLTPGKPVRGFDCGPGNMLLDAWAEKHLGQRYDKGGQWANGGTPIARLLNVLLADPYFFAQPPKSCGRDEFNLDWVDRHLVAKDGAQDVQASLLELTAVTVTDAISRWCGTPQTVLVCGGGVHNIALIARLQAILGECRVVDTESVGQPADWVEAVAFAWLAWQNLRGQAGNLAEVTGAVGPRVLGAIYPR
ncbi:MAG: anhydro-N-acetylmuramic acid kinase [Rhodocyclales bacterium]|nr:anhydro-N-acetylmuramic acid kinase [Rhodocyclales bacterium]